MINYEIGLEFLDNDLSLVDGLQVGSEASFEALVRFYQAPIYNLAYRLLGDPDEASEATQEAFVRIYKSIGRFRGDCSLKTWVYKIALSASLNRRRWRKRWAAIAPLSLDSPAPAGWENSKPLDLSDPGENPESACARRETEQAVQRALDSLAIEFRTVVVLRDIEGLTYEEIANTLAISPGTVKSRLWRGRSQLRKRLLRFIEQRPQGSIAGRALTRSQSERGCGIEVRKGFRTEARTSG